MREWFAYRIQDRQGEPSTILSAYKLFQQFLVDAYTMVESERMCYIQTHQKDLRSDLYKNVKESVLERNENSTLIGKRIVMPSSFTEGARYMIQNYPDAMAICSGMDIRTYSSHSPVILNGPKLSIMYKQETFILKIDQKFYAGFLKSSLIS